MKLGQKLEKIEMAVRLEPFDRFWCINFCLKAIHIYFHLDLTGSALDHYNHRNTAAAGSCGQHCHGNAIFLS